MDATRKRRTKDPLRQRYYALHRCRRFALLGDRRAAKNRRTSCPADEKGATSPSWAYLVVLN